MLLAAEAPKPLPGARTPRNDGRQVEAARDATIALADQTVPLLKDAMDRAHEAEQGRGSGVYEGRLGAGFSQAHGAERALARKPAVIHCPLR